MAEKLDGIAHKLDTVVEKLADVNTKVEVLASNFNSHVAHEEEQVKAMAENTKVLQANTNSLQEHMSRTNMLETYMKKMDERFSPLELESIRKKAVAEWWKTKVIILGKVGAAIGAVGAIAGIVKFLLSAL